MLFVDLPTLLWKVKDPDEICTRLSAVTDELGSAYGQMLAGVRSHLLAALDHDDRPAADLRKRATTVKGITGDLRLDAFAARLELIDDTNSVVEGLISLAVSKPSAQWVDRDIDTGHDCVSHVGCRLPEGGGDGTSSEPPISTSRVSGLVFGASHGCRRHRVCRHR